MGDVSVAVTGPFEGFDGVPCVFGYCSGRYESVEFVVGLALVPWGICHFFVWRGLRRGSPLLCLHLGGMEYTVVFCLGVFRNG